MGRIIVSGGGRLSEAKRFKDGTQWYVVPRLAIAKKQLRGPDVFSIGRAEK